MVGSVVWIVVDWDVVGSCEGGTVDVVLIVELVDCDVTGGSIIIGPPDCGDVTNRV